MACSRANFTIYLYLSVLFYKYNFSVMKITRGGNWGTFEQSHDLLDNAKRWTENSFTVQSARINFGILDDGLRPETK